MISIPALCQAVASMIPDREPTRLAREAVTFVGGSVPGAPRAIGVWSGGTEQASVVHLPADRAAELSTVLAQRNRQKTAVWFTPGPGSDLLHTLTVGMRPQEARKALAKHGVSYATLVPAQNGTTVHVIDQGGDLRGPMQAFASEAGAAYAPTPGTAGYSRTKLSRPPDSAPTYYTANFPGEKNTPLLKDPSGRRPLVGVWAIHTVRDRLGAVHAHALSYHHIEKPHEGSHVWDKGVYYGSYPNAGSAELAAKNAEKRWSAESRESPVLHFPEGDPGGKELSPRHKWAFDLPGGEAPDMPTAEDTLGRSNETTPEDFYAQ